MKNETRWILGLVILFFTVGIIFSSFVIRSVPVFSGPGTLWLSRQFDLFIQVGLFFAGALGIRALLPGEEEEE